MAKAMTPAQRLAQLKKWKVDYRLYPGWETRGRGPMGDVAGYMVHHTGSDSQSDDYLNFLFVRGRPEDGIPAPLCNVATDMDGDLWVGAMLRANHAGSGSSATLAHVRAEDYAGYTTELHPGPDSVNGNPLYYGNEVRFDGGQPMTRVQWVTVVLDAASVCDFHSWSALSVIAHREHTRRKSDPGNTLMYKLRSDVAAALKAGPGNWPTTPKGTTVSVLTTAEQTQLAKSGWLADQFAQGAQFETDLNVLRSDLQMALANIAEMRTVVDAIKAKVDTL